jgi:hypothetical protein
MENVEIEVACLSKKRGIIGNSNVVVLATRAATEENHVMAAHLLGGTETTNVRRNSALCRKVGGIMANPHAWYR